MPPAARKKKEKKADRLLLLKKHVYKALESFLIIIIKVECLNILLLLLSRSSDSRLAPDAPAWPAVAHTRWIRAVLHQNRSIHYAR